jgi:predicted kinase
MTPLTGRNASPGAAGIVIMADVSDGRVVAVLVGLQASGKTTFAARLAASGYVVVSKDAFPNARRRQRRQLRLIADALAAGRDVVVDNTNPAPAEWAPLVGLAREHGAAAVAYWFPPDPAGSWRRNAERPAPARVPEAGLRATLARLRRPGTGDGFEAVRTVRFDGAGGFAVGTDEADEAAPRAR